MIFIGLILCKVIIGNNDVIIVNDVINNKSIPTINGLNSNILIPIILSKYNMFTNEFTSISFVIPVKTYTPMADNIELDTPTKSTCKLNIFKTLKVFVPKAFNTPMLNLFFLML
jgi:hypothetical protein